MERSAGIDPRERLASLSGDARAAALDVLDDISRPLTVAEMDVALAKGGIPRTQRRPMIRALMEQFDVIALEPKI